MKSLLQLTRSRPQPQPTRDPSYFAHWVRKTSELIGRSYIQFVKLVDGWPEHKIERRYKEAMSCNRDLTTPVIRWWSLRKKDKAAS